MPDPSQFVKVSAAQAPFFAGVDLGGTNVKIGVVDDLGRTLSYLTEPTEAEQGAEKGAKRMSDALHRAIADAGLTPSDVKQVGLGSPGTMDVPAGMLLRPHNLPGWFDFPIRDRLSHHCGLPVTFTNDANAAAYGEFWIGAGTTMHSMVMLTLGTGIGCGIIIGDLSIEGENSHGAECGHIIIDPAEDARLCGCGQPGHLEAYCSAPHVENRTELALAAGRESSLSSCIAAGETLTPELLAQEASKGDALSREIIFETARFLGIGAVTLLHTIDPSGIVLGGGMTFGRNQTELGREFLEEFRREVHKRAFPVIADRVMIDYASLGGDAGYVGAAGIARLAWRRAQSA